MDDRSLPGRGDDAELERIAFGPGHTPEEVLAASAALRELRDARERELRESRERDARARAAREPEPSEPAQHDREPSEHERGQHEPRESDARAGVDSARAASGHPLTASSADGTRTATRSRRTLIAGAVLLAVLSAGAGYAAGSSRSPDADTAAGAPDDRGTERSGDLGLYAEDADPIAGAARLFDSAQDPEDVLAAPVATIDPATVRLLASTGNARFWTAQDFDGGYCLVFARYRDGDVIGQEPFCATAEQFAESGNSVTLNGYRVDWTGGDVAVTVTRPGR
jgi:hypothetical protein